MIQDCPTYKNFDFLFQRHITCLKCGDVATGGEMHRDISLELPESDGMKLSVQNLLERAFEVHYVRLGIVAKVLKANRS